MSLAQDIRFGCRTLIKNPGFSTVAILTLAIGIGANTAIFSYVDGVLLKPLPYQNPERICMVWEKPPGGDRNGISTLNYLDWASQNTVFEHMSAQRGDAVTMTGSGKPILLRGARVSAGYFDIFGVRPAMGRTFAAGEDQSGKPRTAVLSNKLWKNQFGGAQDILGRKILLDSEPYTVIGVMPADSPFDRRYSEIWLPLVFQPKDMTRNFHWFGAFARLKPGVTLEQARSQLKTIGERIAQAYPDSNKGWGVTVDRFDERIVGDQLRQSLYVLLGAVGAVLLIGCANLANLTLARGTAREREVAIRVSLGAGRWRLLRQFLTENLLLSLAGGALGLALGFAMVAGLNALTPPFTLPSEASIAIDIRVLLFTLAISIFTGLLFGLVPALEASNPRLAASMKEGGHGTTGGARGRLRSVLVIIETAMAFMLLTGAGLLIRSFDRLMNVPTGFDTTNVLTMNLPLSTTRIKEGDQAAQHIQRILDATAAVPGVRETAITTALPLQGWGAGMPFQIAGKPVADRANRPACFFKSVSPSYFHSLGIVLKQGRGLTARDTKGAPPVAVINETMANRYFKGENPVGKLLMVQEIVYGKPNLGPEIPWQIVGVTSDEKISGLDDNRSGGMYVTYSQSPSAFHLSLIVKGQVNPETMQQTILQAVQQVDRDQPVSEIRTLAQIKSESVGPNRLRTILMGVFAAIAMLLAAIGIYGVISYSVAQRTHEMGLRSALGATAGSILRLVIGGGMARVGIGLLLGLGGALALSKTLKSLLFGITGNDPWTIGAVALGLMTVAVLACYIPARRATKVDPMVALRYE